ncbi:sulfurtransferase TusA family protein [Bacillus pumilus]|uniref:sulfurtransferase TusA family protein n=1 Tax=Bacillus TaxID=1386 RepID=UPI000D045C70|nr:MULTISPECIES: sulfurtransferase TusA family protein [Bacillus]MDF2002802.1 sulfurtransferase TusA family protein [Bacillus pumilus]MDF2023727.1 sulfurtransferase TusA family protein [Bacillus pumilus]MDF2027684.1 sulfurtransferase TusA family protein [Bacillus pumilus]MDF2088613.1 sulfurtransferase TusA family protein [Bacillus pumilus]MDG4729256.1 sulfurtransferase TusA family protein [Bacillus pumilus]
MTSDQILDVTGLACPMPIIRTKKKMNDLKEGQVLEIHATDKGAKADLAAWAKSSGHELITQTDEGHVLKFWVRKGS